MKTSDFDYELPQELIAQTPVEPRDSSRLLVYHRDTGAVEHKIFRDVIDYLNPGDVLVVNQTRVIPARLYGVKEGTGGAIEFLLLRRLNLTDWEVILKPGKKAKPGARFVFGNGDLIAEILTVSEDGSTTREGVFAGGDAVMGARTVVEAVAIAKKVAESMDAYMKSLPVDDAADPYADIPVFRTPTSDVLAKQEL